jgi:glycosyltransferase involved in cell wall biosynthesis
VRSISKKADVVFSYGGKITTIIKSIGVHENRVVELPSGVEETSLALAIRPTNDVIKFLFLGRYERRKGIEELNQAIQKLITHYKDKIFEFHFIGPIPSQKKLNDKHVLYHGEQRDKETLRRLIKNCDVLICPSWSEGLPNVILEAMASGLAVIATDVGATSILVNEQTGWLLKSSSPEEILSVIEMVLSLAPSVLDQKKQNALNLVSEDFTWEKLIHQLIDRMKYKNNNHLVGKLK